MTDIEHRGAKQERPSNDFKQTVRQYRLQTPEGTIPYGVGCAWVRSYADKRGLREGVAALQGAYSSGARYFDTSEAYGESEQVVGEFVRTIPRQTIFLATKSRLPDLKPAEAAAHIRLQLERSIRHLQTDYLDLFQLHDAASCYEADGVWPEVLDVLTDARKRGLIRYFGMAIRSHGMLEMAIRHGAYASILTYGDFTPVNQSAGPLIRMAADAEVGAVNGSPLGNAWLNGRDPRQRDPGRDSKQIRMQREAIAFYDFCQSQGVPVLAAVLQYPLRNRDIDMNLTGPASAAQWQESMEALRIKLPASFWTDWSSLGRHWAAMTKHTDGED
ncbi:aldo/keto reductase [Paenibacillus sp. HB172176]|uniref:aldo/keto reductase n=1 Tax=Paenibacillus sp. HB172176 TaxID=2493690 RepID=UPI0014396FA3|nr:aldo/keto reductase [Paenibacillus sp. HB172176]